MSRINRPQSAPIHRARVPGAPGLAARIRRNAAQEASPVSLDAPFAVDRVSGKQTIAHDSTLRIAQNKLGINPLPARSDLSSSATLEQTIAAYNKLVADLRAKGLMLK